MDHFSSYRRINFSSSVEYRICVEGKLSRDLSERLAGMKISRSTRANGLAITILRGKLCDQSELMGVLNSLYNLHMPIISVQVIKKEQRFVKERN